MEPIIMTKFKKIIALSAVAGASFGIAFSLSAVATTTAYTITAVADPAISLSIDNTTYREFFDVNGDPVYILNYNGTTYLPIRALGTLLGKEVHWYGDEKRASLFDVGSAEYLVLNNASEDPVLVPTAPEDMVSYSDAISALLATTVYHPDSSGNPDLSRPINFTSDDIVVTDISVTTYDQVYNGKTYPIEVYSITYWRGNYRVTGIVRTNYNEEGKVEVGGGSAKEYSTAQSFSTSSYFGNSNATKVALEDANLSASDVTNLSTVLYLFDDYDQYVVSFTYDRKYCEYNIGAYQGTIISSPSHLGEDSSQQLLTEDQAKDICRNSLFDFMGSTVFQSCELGERDGMQIYTLKATKDGKSYTFEVNASTGLLLSTTIG